MNHPRRGTRIPGTGYDCPPEFFNYRDDAPELFERAERALFERRVGETCDEVMGYMRPAETAVLAWLAAMLKAPASAKPNHQRIGEDAARLIADWRAEIIASLDRDEIEAEAERLADHD